MMMMMMMNHWRASMHLHRVVPGPPHLTGLASSGGSLAASN